MGIAATVLIVLCSASAAFSQVAFGKVDGGSPLQSRFSRISPNRDIYAIARPPDLNLQLSFKYQLWNFDVCNSDLRGFHVAYNLKSFWELNTSAFKEFNHDFEFLWEKRFEASRRIRLFRVGIWEHESDGIDGDEDVPDTASWDRHYLQAIFGKFSKDSYNLNLDIKIWRQFGGKNPLRSVKKPPRDVKKRDNWSSDDRELKDHLGWYEIRPVYTFMGIVPDDVPFRFQAAVTFRKLGFAQEPDTTAYQHRKGSVQLDLKWAIIGDANAILYFQYFRGYGENIRHFIEPGRFEHDAFVNAIKVGLQLKH